MEKNLNECFTEDDIEKIINKSAVDGVIVHAALVSYLNNRAAEYAANQNRELIAWKESGLKVLNEIDLQAIGKELGVPLGQSVSENMLQKIKEYAAGKVAGMFTEGQVRHAIRLAVNHNDDYYDTEEEIINQIKQSK